MYYLLSVHPEVLSRVRAEHDQFVGKDLNTTIATLTSSPQVLNKLVLTSAVLKEVLRLFPIGFTVRKAQPGTTLSYKGRTYPMDNHMVTNLYPHMQRNPKFWSDPNSFDPDRWLDADRHDLGKENGSWQPFERGPRNCIGQQLSLVEARVIAVLTLRYFDFEPRLKNDGLSIPGWGGQAFQVFKMTAKPKDGIPMVVKLRNE
jgi:cytochrome P450